MKLRSRGQLGLTLSYNRGLGFPVGELLSSRLDCCNSVLYSAVDIQFRRLQSAQNAAVRLVTGTR